MTIQDEDISKTEEISSLKDQISKLERENERLSRSEKQLQDTLAGQPITIKWQSCNNCGKKFDDEDEATSCFTLEECSAVSNSTDHFHCNILISLLAMVRQLYKSCRGWSRVRSPR